MTINVVVVTTDAVVLGCDSIASSMKPVIDPFQVFERDEKQSFVADAEGRYTAKFTANDIQWIVNNAWGGVTKLFQLHGQMAPVAAVTAGLAKLKNKNISNIAAQYYQQKTSSPFRTVKEVVTDFLQFMREQYAEHYKGSGEQPIDLREDLRFLVGGHGQDDPFPSAWELDVKNDTSKPVFQEGRTGISWGGQADAVERHFLGVDSRLRAKIDTQVRDAFDGYRQQMHGAVLAYLNENFGGRGADLPPLTLPDTPTADLAWQDGWYYIDCGNLPVQGAVDVVSQLAMMQSLRARYGGGVPTVGGRIRVGVVTRDGFRALNEPQLEHKYTGLGDVI
ncbi:MAG: hypothetical protein HY423_16310 [Candidatus Lambdaproteobacteria bacterium]|nr:hypothetical protein [Candidatus Lambdaproteobacteria bacterium]